MIRLNNVWILSFIFLMILVGLFFFLGFDNVFFSGPGGIHFMRQTDSLSFASQYFNNGFHFFKPQLYNLKNIEGYAACEFPVTYYLTAILYSVFGKNVVILKLLHLLIAYTGVFFIFRLSYHILKNYFYALIVSLFLFTSTVFIYYSFNYLPDAPALGLTFTGWYFIFRYQSDKKLNSALLGFLFFTVGSLIKVTYLINPLAVIVFYVFAQFFRKEDFHQNNETKKAIVLGFSGVMIVAVWNIYILYYNAFYHSNSFNLYATPMWYFSGEQNRVVWDYIVNYWYSKYFAHSSFHLLFLILPFQLIFLKKSDFALYLITFILLAGSFAYFILFYAQFRDHDYYALAFFPLIVLVLINGLKTLQNISMNRYLHISIQVIFAVIVIAGINYSGMKLKDRYKNRIDDFSKASLLIQENAEAIAKLNIPVNSKWIVAPDLCQNGGLFFLDRMGWNIEKKEDITEERIHYFKNLGAEYLLIADENPPFSEIDCTYEEMIQSKKGIYIFKLTRN